jgi:hypothetical protein
LCLAERAGAGGGVGGGNGFGHQPFGIVDEQTVDDLAPGRRPGLRGHAGGAHRRAIPDAGVAVDSAEPDWAVGDD